uniref:phospholipase D n=1 Tax=Desulfovibrio sp. U5L TaxID=596152 RepID=I2Q057_9BACT
MKKIFFLLCFLAICSTSYAYELTFHDSPTSVYFSPHGGAQNAINNAIDQAKQNVLVQAFNLSNKSIIRSLCSAAQRGVQVQVIQDAKQHAKSPKAAQELSHAGAAVFFDAMHHVAHNKIMIIDGSTVITGSFNFTQAANDSNAENILVIHDIGLARLYAQNWQNHREHSEGY